MRYAFVPVAFGLGTNALVARWAPQCYQLQASGGASGVLGQLSDGQNRVGGGHPTGCYCLSVDNGGSFTDSNGRGCILTPPTTQFQCDVGAKGTTGFAIGYGGVTYNGSGTFYACPATSTGEYNIYTKPVEGQAKCVEISLSTAGSCGVGSSASKPPASQSSSSQPAGYYPTTVSKASASTFSTQTPPYPTGPAPSPHYSGTGYSSVYPSPSSKPAYSAPSVLPSIPAASSQPGSPQQSQAPPSPGIPMYTVPQESVCVPFTHTVFVTATVEIPTESDTFVYPSPTSIPGGCNPAHPGSCPPSYFDTTSSWTYPSATSIPGGCNPAHPGSCPPSYFDTTSSFTYPSATSIPGGCNPAHPGSCPSSYFDTTAPAASWTYPSPTSIPGGCNPAHPGSCPSSYFDTTSSWSYPSATSIPGGCNPAHPGSCPSSYFDTTVPAASATYPAATPAKTPGLSGACPANLNGKYEFPHLIVPVDSQHPNQANGTSYNGVINSHVCTIFNFDIPSSMAGKQCTTIFLLPKKEDLETSDYTISGSGMCTFSKMKTPANEHTTYANKSEKISDVASVQLSPGNSYTVDTGACAAGQTVSYMMCSSGDFSFEYFEDWNPSPLGLFIREC